MTANRELGGTPYWEWLLAVPLLHQLQSPAGTQVDHMYFDPEKPDWGWHGLNRSNLREFRLHIQSKKLVVLKCTNVTLQAHVIYY